MNGYCMVDIIDYLWVNYLGYLCLCFVDSPVKLLSSVLNKVARIYSCRHFVSDKSTVNKTWQKN